MNLDWIKESERMCSIETNLLREKLSSISMMFIYINQNKVIEFIENEILLLPDSSNIIPKEKLLKLIKSKQKNTSISKYIFKELLVYHVPLEAEQISSFVHSSEDTFFMNIVSIIEDIILPPSIFVFHSINGLYFFYYESIDPHSKIKSILKTDKIIHTKKVKINAGSRCTRRNTILIDEYIE